MIEITQEQTERVHAILSGIKGAAPRALYNVINRALGTVRSQSGKAIRQTYNIKQSDVTANGNMKVKRATEGDLVGEITFAGAVIPLKKFKVSPTEPRKQTVSVSVLREEGGKRLQHAYVANLGLYGAGVYERATRRRESSEQLFGPSVAHMAGSEDVLSQVEEAAQDTINKRIDQEISRILNGYGG